MAFNADGYYETAGARRRREYALEKAAAILALLETEGGIQAAVHEAYVNAQRAVTEVKWGEGSYGYILGRSSMQEDAVRAIRTAAEEARG
jgi:hypothetical protein